MCNWVLLNLPVFAQQSRETVIANILNRLIYEEGDIVISMQLQSAGVFHDGLAAVKKDGKYGFINRQGSIVIPFQYSFVNNYSEGLAMVANYGKCGYINKQGKPVIPLQYDYDMYPYAQSFSEGLAAVKEDGKWFYIDRQGNIPNTSSTVTRDEYVDLGLPSGTLWKSRNESGGFYTYKEAISKYSYRLPTKTQFEELAQYCSFVRTDKDYKVIGPNGNYIIMPSGGHREWTGNVEGFSCGYYWTSTSNGTERVFFFFTCGQSMATTSREEGLFVQLENDSRTRKRNVWYFYEI